MVVRPIVCSTRAGPPRLKHRRKNDERGDGQHLVELLTVANPFDSHKGEEVEYAGRGCRSCYYADGRVAGEEITLACGSDKAVYQVE